MTAQQKIEADPRLKLEAALAEALPKLEGAKKNSANPHFKSKYADLGAVIEAIRPVAEHGVWFRQVLHESERGVTVETLYTGFGATVSAGTLFMPASKADAQGYGSALTYARRYALQTAFGLATEDDDGNAAARGQSQSKGAVSPSEPTEGRNGSPPARVKLDGPYTSGTQLKTAVKEFVRSMQGCGDWDEWTAFRDTKDVRELIEQVKRDMPQWWDGGPDMPEEFVPLHRQIEMHEAALGRQIADIARV